MNPGAKFIMKLEGRGMWSSAQVDELTSNWLIVNLPLTLEKMCKDVHWYEEG